MSGNKICSVILGAPDGYINKPLPGDFVICADKGLDHALAAGITPNIVVGDFDSAERSLPQGIPCIAVSPIKDDTDAILAADTAMERGFKELHFYCALGGRLDHTIANIQMLEYLEARGARGYLYGEGQRVYLSSDRETIPAFAGYLSVFALGEAVVSESGVKYPIDQYTIKSDYPIGVSNEIVSDCAEIIVHKGKILICECRADKAITGRTV